MPMLCIFSHMGVLLFRFLSVCCPFCSLSPLPDRRCSSSWIVALQFRQWTLCECGFAHFAACTFLEFFVHIFPGAVQGALQLDS